MMKTFVKMSMLIFCLVAVSACKNENKNKSVVESLMEGDFESITSDRIIDEGKEYAQLFEVVAKNTKIKDKRVEFSLSKREFKKTGLDGDYYDKIQKQVKGFNNMLDSEPAKNADQTLKEFFKYLKSKWGEITE